MKSGIELIADERQEQIEKHNRTVEQDVIINKTYQLPVAARRLLEYPGEIPHGTTPPHNWDTPTWLKMAFKPYRDRLIIAGALIAAEIDRMQALETTVKEREFPCDQCGEGEFVQIGSTQPNGTVNYECNGCGHGVSFP